MEMIEKVERLRERADVTYEEAKAALEEASGDLLDAMVILERMGKVRGPAGVLTQRSMTNRRIISGSEIRWSSRRSLRRVLPTLSDGS